MVCTPTPATAKPGPTLLEAPNGHSSNENKCQNQQYCQKDEEPCIVSNDELISLILEAGGGAQCAYGHAISHARMGRNVNSRYCRHFYSFRLCCLLTPVWKQISPVWFYLHQAGAYTAPDWGLYHARLRLISRQAEAYPAPDWSFALKCNMFTRAVLPYLRKFLKIFLINIYWVDS